MSKDIEEFPDSPEVMGQSAEGTKGTTDPEGLRVSDTSSSKSNLNNDIEACIDCPQECSKPLTVSAKVTVKPDAHAEFGKWYSDMQLIQRACKGYLSSELIRPVGLGNNEYISIFRYDSYENLQGFLTSSERLELIAKLEPLLESSVNLSYHSMEFWFEHDGEQAKAKRPPPKWKMSMVTIFVIFCLLQAYPRLLNSITPDLHPLLFTFINLLFIVPTSTYIVMPVLTRLLAFWLFPDSNYICILKELIPPCFREQEDTHTESSSNESKE